MRAISSHLTFIDTNQKIIHLWLISTQITLTELTGMGIFSEISGISEEENQLLEQCRS